MKKITRSTYDQIAPSFACVNAEMPENVLLTARKFLETIPGNGRCLDLGCGTGRDLAWFEQQDVNIIGADFSTGMLAQARKITACPLVQMDMLQLGFADQSFSGIWCNAALLHLPKAEAPQALKEMRRILFNGGILNLALQAGDGEQFETNPYEGGQGQRFFARYTQPEITIMLIANGFAVLEIAKVLTKRIWLRFVAQRLG